MRQVVVRAVRLAVRRGQFTRDIARKLQRLVAALEPASILPTPVMPVQPRTTQGVLELLPAQQIAFQRMLDTIRRNFELFGFLPVETPVFELTDVLLTKSGGETEKQVYFVQSTGSLTP